ncbi:MAG: tetratricopeptide repeat protein, partial [Blastocatellia bacterium]
YQQGVELSRKGKFKDAVTDLTKAVESDPSFSDAYVELGYALYRLKRYEESINASRQATILYSDFKPYYNMGLVYMAQKNWSIASNQSLPA